jgi:hypothetical protein
LRQAGVPYWEIHANIDKGSLPAAAGVLLRFFRHAPSKIIAYQPLML